jgi:hypothetical protein
MPETSKRTKKHESLKKQKTNKHKENANKGKDKVFSHRNTVNTMSK